MHGIRRISFVVITLLIMMTFSTIDILLAQLVYGSRVEAMNSVNCLGKEVIIPVAGSVNVLCLFDITSPGHISTLNNLNFPVANLDQGQGKPIRVFAISKGKEDLFTDLYRKYGLMFDIVNDQKGSLLKLFNPECSTCMKFIILDKHQSIRYISSGFDPAFLREIIQRYNKEILAYE